MSLITIFNTYKSNHFEEQLSLSQRPFCQSDNLDHSQSAIQSSIKKVLEILMNTIFRTSKNNAAQTSHGFWNHFNQLGNLKPSTPQSLSVEEKRSFECRPSGGWIKFNQNSKEQGKTVSRQKNSQSTLRAQFKINTDRDNAVLIDRILLKTFLLNLKLPSGRPVLNTSIESMDQFSSQTQKNQKKYQYFGKFSPHITQNEEQRKQFLRGFTKTNQGVDLNKIKTAIMSNKDFCLTKTGTQKKFSKEGYNQAKLNSENISPSQNQWQNSMKMIRMEKQKTEKNKKYCRIMIRRINTDQLFIKRKDCHLKIRHKNTANLIKAPPATKENTYDQEKRMKTPLTISPPAIQQSFPNFQNIEVNPWSTTDIKPRQQIELGYHF